MSLIKKLGLGLGLSLVLASCSPENNSPESKKDYKQKENKTEERYSERSEREYSRERNNIRSDNEIQNLEKTFEKYLIAQEKREEPQRVKEDEEFEERKMILAEIEKRQRENPNKTREEIISELMGYSERKRAEIAKKRTNKPQEIDLFGEKLTKSSPIKGLEKAFILPPEQMRDLQYYSANGINLIVGTTKLDDIDLVESNIYLKNPQDRIDITVKALNQIRELRRRGIVDRNEKILVYSDGRIKSINGSPMSEISKTALERYLISIQKETPEYFLTRMGKCIDGVSSDITITTNPEEMYKLGVEPLKMKLLEEIAGRWPTTEEKNEAEKIMSKQYPPLPSNITPEKLRRTEKIIEELERGNPPLKINPCLYSEFVGINPEMIKSFAGIYSISELIKYIPTAKELEKINLDDCTEINPIIRKGDGSRLNKEISIFLTIPTQQRNLDFSLDIKNYLSKEEIKRKIQKAKQQIYINSEGISMEPSDEISRSLEAQEWVKKYAKKRGFVDISPLFQ